MEELQGQAGGAVQTAGVKKAAQVGIDVKGPVGPVAGDSGHGVERLDDKATAAAILLQHVLNGVLGPAEGRHGRFLGDGVGIGGAVALDLEHGLDERSGPQTETNPPASHGVGLGYRSHDDQVVPVGFPQGGQRKG